MSEGPAKQMRSHWRLSEGPAHEGDQNTTELHSKPTKAQLKLNSKPRHRPRTINATQIELYTQKLNSTLKRSGPRGLWPTQIMIIHPSDNVRLCFVVLPEGCVDRGKLANLCAHEEKWDHVV